MALDMVLELEGHRPDWEACLEAARMTGVSTLESDGVRLIDGAFERSGVYFWRGVSGFGEEGELLPVRAEGNHSCDFLTRYVIIFRLNNSEYDDSVQDLKQFLTHLAALSPMKFVLSFQREEVRAERCTSGMDWFWDAPR